MTPARSRPPVPVTARRAGLLAALVLSATAVLVAPSAAPAHGDEGATPAGAVDGPADPGPTPRLVHAGYSLFLDRTPTPEEARNAAFVVHRHGRGALTERLAASPEWAGIQVAALYRDVLGRDHDEDGVAFWLDRIRRGATLESVAAHFWGSAELRARVGGTDGAFVDELYRQLLERDADAAGRTHWIDQLERGHLTHAAVAAAFFDSIESRRQRVQARYAEVLGRRPSAHASEYWAGVVRTRGDVHLAAALAASDEFHVAATGVAPPTITVAAVGSGTRYPLTSSWRSGCPVAPSDLVAVEFPHAVLDDDAERQLADGVLIVHRDVVDDASTAAAAIYGFDFPLAQARPVDDFGGDDDASMAADNTSAFNCRVVAGTTTWSRHAHGTAIDINPVENPSLRDGTTDPPGGSAYTDRGDVRPGMLVEGGPIVDTFDRLGWGWGGRWRDPDHHHFSRSGR